MCHQEKKVFDQSACTPDYLFLLCVCQLNEKHTKLKRKIRQYERKRLFIARLYLYCTHTTAYPHSHDIWIY